MYHRLTAQQYPTWFSIHAEFNVVPIGFRCDAIRDSVVYPPYVKTRITSTHTVGTLATIQDSLRTHTPICDTRAVVKLCVDHMIVLV